MLYLTIPKTELYDEDRNLFYYIDEQTIKLEHSLVSISKWESKWKKPFMSAQQRTYEESIDYIRFMTITQNVKPEAYYALTDEQIRIVNEYIDDPMTATTISSNGPSNGPHKIITSEVIYSWMITLGIPFECQKWHLNRLVMLIQVCQIHNSPDKKMGKGEILAQNRDLNKARRAAMGSKG